MNLLTKKPNRKRPCEKYYRWADNVYLEKIMVIPVLCRINDLLREGNFITQDYPHTGSKKNDIILEVNKRQLKTEEDLTSILMTGIMVASPHYDVKVLHPTTVSNDRLQDIEQSPDDLFPRKIHKANLPTHGMQGIF